jgi:hypothetical protein
MNTECEQLENAFSCPSAGEELHSESILGIDSTAVPYDTPVAKSAFNSEEQAESAQSSIFV